MATIYQNLTSGTTTDNPLAIGALAFNSGGLSSLAAVVGPDTMWVTLDPLAVNGAPEIVQITAHTAAATSATIVRAQQGTAARQHPQNTKWVGGIVTKADLDLLPHRLLTAKGGLISASAANTPAVLAVGSNTQALVADSAQATGLKYAEYLDNKFGHVKGGILIPDGTNYAVHAAPSDGSILVASAAAADGWTSVPGSGVVGGATAYTPAFTSNGGTNPTIGNSTVFGEYFRFGKLVFGFFVITVGSTFVNGTAGINVSVPLSIASTNGNGYYMGNGMMGPSNAATGSGLVLIKQGSTTVALHQDTRNQTQAWTDIVLTQATNGVLKGKFLYETDAP